MFVPVIYSDDPDPSWTFTVTSRDATLVDWASPLVAIDDAGYTVAGTWIGSPATQRQIRVPLSGLSVGSHAVYLRVPNGPDILAGIVSTQPRV